MITILTKAFLIALFAFVCNNVWSMSFNTSWPRWLRQGSYIGVTHTHLPALLGLLLGSQLLFRVSSAPEFSRGKGVYIALGLVVLARALWVRMLYIDYPLFGFLLGVSPSERATLQSLAITLPEAMALATVLYVYLTAGLKPALLASGACAILGGIGKAYLPEPASDWTMFLAAAAIAFSILQCHTRILRDNHDI